MSNRIWKYSSRRHCARKAYGGAGSVEEPASEAFGLKPRSYTNTSGPLATEPQILDVDNKTMFEEVVSSVQYEKIKTNYDLDRSYWFSGDSKIFHPPVPPNITEVSNLQPSDLQVPETWDELGLSNDFVDLAKEYIGERPSSVQKDVIPGMLNIKDRDIVYSSATGTGKTMAYILSLLQLISREDRGVNLILVPSKQLAMQIYAFALKWSKKGEIYGRNDREWLQLHLSDPNEDSDKMHEQYTALKSTWYGGPRLVIAQPNRWVDYLIHWRLTLPIRRIIIDEAFTCFDPIHPTKSPIRERNHRNIHPNTTDIIMSNYLAFPAFKTLVRAQVIMLTATFTPVLENHVERYLKTDKWVHLTTKQQFPEHIKHKFIKTENATGTLLLKANELLPEINKAIVFVSNTEDIDSVYQDMLESGLKTRMFDLSSRENATLPTSDSSWQFLLLREGVSYGLDIEGITHCFITHLPSSTESYCHMVGRCGRFASPGTAYSLVGSSEIIKWDRSMHQLDIPLSSRLVDESGKSLENEVLSLQDGEAKLLIDGEEQLKQNRLAKYTGKRNVQLYTLARPAGSAWEKTQPAHSLQTMLGQQKLPNHYVGPMTASELDKARDDHKKKFIEVASMHGIHNRYKAMFFPYAKEYTQQHLEHQTHKFMMKWGRSTGRAGKSRYQKLSGVMNSQIHRMRYLLEERQMSKFKRSISLEPDEKDIVHQGIPVVSRRLVEGKPSNKWATVSHLSSSPIDEYLKGAELFDYDKHQQNAVKKEAELAEYDEQMRLDNNNSTPPLDSIPSNVNNA